MRVPHARMTAAMAVALNLWALAPASAQLVGLPNPASSFCAATGGEVVISDGPAGQSGICQYASGLAVEEWSLYRLFAGFDLLSAF